MSGAPVVVVVVVLVVVVLVVVVLVVMVLVVVVLVVVEVVVVGGPGRLQVAIVDMSANEAHLLHVAF